MLIALFNIIAPVFAIAAVGYLWGRRASGFQMEFVTRLITAIGAPCLIVSVMDQAEMSMTSFGEMALLAAAMLGGNLLLGAAVIARLGLQQKSLLPAVVFPNTGNMGLSLCLFAFGEPGLALALVVFVCLSLVHFISADVLLSRESDLFRRIGLVLRQPIIWAAAVALATMTFAVELPVWIGSTLKLFADMTIPLMLLTLGYSLSRLQAGDWHRGLLFAGLRVGGGILVGLAVVHLFNAEGLAARVIILMSALPSAVFNYLFALKYDRDAGLVASIVVISTLLSFVTLPLLLAFLV